MKVVLGDRKDASVVKVRVGSLLDLAACRMFAEAAVRAAADPEVAALAVDLSDAHWISDAVITMLADLKVKAMCLGVPLHLVNVNPYIRHRLSMVEFSTIHINRYASVGVYVHQMRGAPV